MIKMIKNRLIRSRRQKHPLRLWEVSLLTALCVTLCAGMLAGRTQEDLSSRLVRLHVVANSDSPGDQAEKLQLRDRILSLLSPLLEDCGSREEAVDIILSHQRELEALGDVEVRLDREYFPTRRYGTFALPAGEYLSLRVTMGAGAGENWWCVVFPPLCTEALAETPEEDAFLALDDDTAALITRETPVYELRFRVVELWGELREWFSGRA